MKIFESIIVAMGALGANKLRSALTALGIVIGIGAVISLMSIGRGAEASITSAIRDVGSNLIFVTPGAATAMGVKQAAGSRATLTLEDAEALAYPLNAPSVAMVAPESSTYAQVVAGNQNVNTRVTGTTPDYQWVRNTPVAIGDFINQQHMNARSRVAVLGSAVADSLFGGEDPIDKTVNINRQKFTVIGVLEAKGGTGYMSQDDLVVVPLTTLQSRLTSTRGFQGSHSVQTINVQAVDEKEIEAAKEQIREILREQHRLTGEEDDFNITTQEDILGAMTQVTGLMTLFLGAIAGISLIVGGIGIMNIMLVSVTERTREIGIRKAVGAKRRDVMMQFLVESAILSSVGGAIGVGGGWIVSKVIAQVISAQGQSFETLVSPDIVLLAFSVSAAIGIFFGIYPAYRAARLNPIDALRYE